MPAGAPRERQQGTLGALAPKDRCGRHVLHPRFALRDAAAIDRFGIPTCNDGIITELANAFSPEHCVMVDGLQNGIPARVVRIIKGESVSIAIALASILAKEHRDALLLRLDAEYPLYGFAGHKGYGTELHLNAIREHGLIPGIHRRSFLKNIVCRRPAAIIAPLVA